jgi:hypothetical protein
MYAAISICPWRFFPACTIHTQLQNHVPWPSYWRHSNNWRRSFQSRTSLNSTGSPRTQTNRYQVCSAKFPGSLRCYIVTTQKVQDISQKWREVTGNVTQLMLIPVKLHYTEHDKSFRFRKHEGHLPQENVSIARQWPAAIAVSVQSSNVVAGMALNKM